jgi:hypothetical protein
MDDPRFSEGLVLDPTPDRLRCPYAPRGCKVVSMAKHRNVRRRSIRLHEARCEFRPREPTKK